MDIYAKSKSTLPNWGPYTKRYAGISHIADEERGIRFDVSVFPGLYRRKVDVPNVTWESDFHPWEASADLSYYCLRHELVWKDQVYADISYTRLDDNATLIRCEMVNNTDAPENFALHYMGYINYPAQPKHSHLYKPMEIYDVNCPEGVVSLHALDYDEMGYNTPRPTDNLMPDGLKRGELRYSGLVNGSGLGLPRGDSRLSAGFGSESGDWVRYRFNLSRGIKNAAMRIRYAQWQAGAKFAMQGSASGEVAFPKCEGMGFITIPLGSLAAGENEITLKSLGEGPVLFDSIVIGSQDDVASCEYLLRDTNPAPTISARESERMLALKYSSCPQHYGLYWDFDMFWVREILNSELDRFMRANVHHHTSHVMVGDREGHFTNVFMRPIPVPAGEKRVVFGLAVNAESEQQTFEVLSKHAANAANFEYLYNQARAKRVVFGNGAGESLKLSQELMAATTLTNLVFPVYKKRGYIRHNTPGRWWDCLYTWDSGFVGIGLNTISPPRAAECLRDYLTDPGDEHNAFIHHGSMVPTQFYLFNEIWNRTQSKELLEYCYPRLRQYYEFYVGRLGSSTMDALKSGLLKTWDYFYNSGGWDDYPPQVHVHKNALEGTITPSANTSHAIRCARMLIQLARELGGLNDDIARYEADAQRLMNALNSYAYDAETGYYGYVRHDENGQPTGILRHESGQNFNMGLDGIEPIMTGLLPDDKISRMVELLMEPGRLWCDIGLSTVDQAANYYTVDGYWNGAVWMPHQWFVFKALLDAGRADEAFRIADTALCVWRDEVNQSYNCFEHFIVASRRGAGWHQFSALSTPVMYWHDAYFTPGRLTFGFDVWAKTVSFSDDNRSLRAELRLNGASHRNAVAIATVANAKGAIARFNGKPIEARVRVGNALELLIPNSATEGVLEITTD